jgi:hypothetical protein
VIGGHYRLAVECDGDTWHGPKEYERDLARQRDLERCGWTFFRIRESEFYIDPHAVLRRLWEQVDAMEGAGVKHEPEAAAAPESPTVDGDLSGPDPSDEVSDDAMPRPAHGRADPLEPAEADEPDRPDAATAPPVRTDPVPEPPTNPVPAPARMYPNNEIVLQARAPKVVEVEPTPLPAHGGGGRHAKPDDAPALNTPATRGPALAEYRAFTGKLESAWNSSPYKLSDSVERIVVTEGPVVGDRIYAAYATASDEALSRELIGAVDVALAGLIHQGAIVCDDPLNQGRVWRTYRTSTQKTVLRTLGPRILQQVPPKELALLLAGIGAKPGSPMAGLYPEALGHLGVRATAEEMGMLRRALPLVKGKR